jgi:hypothetical protein
MKKFREKDPGGFESKPPGSGNKKGPLTGPFLF